MRILKVESCCNKLIPSGEQKLSVHHLLQTSFHRFHEFKTFMLIICSREFSFLDESLNLTECSKHLCRQPIKFSEKINKTSHGLSIPQDFLFFNIQKSQLTALSRGSRLMGLDMSYLEQKQNHHNAQTCI